MELYGYHPASITSSPRDSSKVEVVEDHMKHQQQVLQLLKDNPNLEQNQVKQQTDQHRNENWVDYLRVIPKNLNPE